MICQHKRGHTAFEIMPPMFKGLNYHQHFLIPCAVSRLCLIKFKGIEGDGAPVADPLVVHKMLRKHSSSTEASVPRRQGLFGSQCLSIGPWVNTSFNLPNAASAAGVQMKGPFSRPRSIPFNNSEIGAVME